MPDEKPPINLDDIDFGHTIRGHQKGDRVFERFILQRLLGRGGMGVVWLAQDERLGREVALKFAPEAVRYDDVAVDELKEETRKGLNLAHPGIVKIYDFLLDEDHAAISMEFIDGENLGALRTRQPNKVFEARQLALWTSQMLEALDYAHRVAKVIHRDLKPANLMIDREGNLRVTDFGIARSISDAMNRATLAVGNSTGTLAYMSPQQADGKKPHVSDDLYAFGSTLYELMTGKPPFFSGNIIHQLKEDPVQSLTERRLEFGIVNAEPIPVEWEQTILACLEKSPENRPSSAQVVRQRLGLAPVVPGEVPPLPQTSLGMAASGAGEPSPYPAGHHTSHAGATQTYVRAGAGLTEIHVPSRPIGAGAIKMGPSVTPAKVPSQGAGEPVKARSSSALIWIVLIFLLMGLATIGGAGWWAYNNLPFFKKKKDPEVVVHPVPPPSPPPLDPPLAPTNKDPVPKSPVPDPAPTKPAPPPSPRPPDPVPVTPKVTTIQAAINAAKAGETVVIPEGLYEEQLRFKSGVNLKAEVVGKVIVQTDGEVGSAFLADNCSGGTISGFVFQHAGQDAAEKTNWPVVMIKSSSLVLENCTVRSGVGDGLYMTGACKIQILHCLVEKNLGHGLVFESGVSGLVADCESRRNGENGAEVRFNGTFPVFERCLFLENGLSGVAIRDGAAANVTSKTVCKGNIEAGVAAAGEGVRVTLAGVTCEENLMGVTVQQQAYCRISDCRILLSKEVGIHLDMPAPGSEVLNNEVEKSKLDGILATGAEGVVIAIVGNKIKGSAGNGLLVYGAGFKPRIEQNECFTNAKYGILAIEGVAGTIQENTVRGNHMGSIVNSGAAAGLVIQGNIADESAR